MERSDEARRRDNLYDRLDSAERSNRKLEERIKELKIGLEIYGSHQKWCKVNHKEKIDCDCGYEQILEGGD